jgi:uncharacterized protein related to proFAR isomerase
VCATDLELVKGYMGFRGVLGHEWVGVVEDAPDRAWIGAGGVRDAADLRAAAGSGAAGWLVASALHDGTLQAA